MSRTENIIRTNGPMLSGKLCQLLMEKYNISSSTARKEISRATFPVQKNRKLPFDKNQVFVYLNSQYNTQEYCVNLYESIKNSSSGLSSIVYALENSFGIMKKDLLPIYSSSPIENTLGHRVFSQNIKTLIENGLITEKEDYYELSSKHSGIIPNLNCANGLAIVNKMLVKDYIAWSQKLNLMAFNAAKAHPEAPNFAHFAWLASSPSYFYPLSIGKNNGFTVVDVLWKINTDINDVKFFVDKVNTIKSFKNLRRVAPILLVNSLTTDALNYLKEKQILFFITSNLFDKEYSNTLNNIFTVLKNPVSIIKNKPECIEDVLDSIKKFDGMFNNVMGALFESLVGLFYVEAGDELIGINLEIKNDKGTKYEMDVLTRKDDTITITECKALRSQLDTDYLQPWLDTRVQCFNSWVQQNYPNHNITYEIWALSGFTDNAKDLLNNYRIANADDYTLEFRDKSEIREYAKTRGGTKFNKQLKEHYKDYGNKTKKSRTNKSK